MRVEAVRLFRSAPGPVRKGVRAVIRALLPPALGPRLQLSLHDFRRTPPILVYQMAKVGSSSVYASLKAAGLPNPVFHVHFLSEDGLRRAEGRYTEAGLAFPPYLQVNRELRRKILAVGPSFEWNIVTMVREPIARYVSSVFQIVKARLPELIGDDGRISVPQMLERLERYFSTYDESNDACATWFAEELESMTGVNVYEHPFDREKGFSCIRAGTVRVLLIRMETLGACFQEAMSAFFERPVAIPLVGRNVGETKWYAGEYRQVTRQLRIPLKICERIYQSTYARHFYGEEMRQAFMRKWCGE